ncbi:mitochondrial ubiquitin ligase activator of nfkb 1-like isoform X1 [Haliotis cracherodii]|uniref:mitochondrial ubiquitin ligase activator of nfkb 1-like isoform X1 n=1 Tax=Haliotis cracherodii TaxID=6455 RepID=UPI0039E892BF
MGLDISEKVATFTLGVTGLLTTLFYKLYSSRERTADRVRNARNVPLKDLHDVLRDHDNRLAYATVEGIVDPYFQQLVSVHGTMKGVIQHIQKVEHKSKRVQGYWSDAKKIMQDTLEAVPFKLVEPLKSEHAVYVNEALSADLLQDELTVTFDHFEPGKSSLLQSGIDRIFGEVSKGIQDTEKMLLVGTSLRGIGELCLEDGKAMIGPPSDGSRFILTKLSKASVVRKFESQAYVYKFLTVLFGAVSSGVLFFILWKFYRKWKDIRQQQAAFALIRATNDHSLPDSDGSDSNQQCVVCLSSRRSVIIMDCRHVCVCSNCAERLPSPKKCPVCRRYVQQFLPLFNA